jgi:hypothetical protein
MGAHFCFQGRVHPTYYVVTCKKCARSIPTGVTKFPKNNVTVRKSAGQYYRQTIALSTSTNADRGL